MVDVDLPQFKECSFYKKDIFNQQIGLFTQVFNRIILIYSNTDIILVLSSRLIVKSLVNVTSTFILFYSIKNLSQNLRIDRQIFFIIIYITVHAMKNNFDWLPILYLQNKQISYGPIIYRPENIDIFFYIRDNFLLTIILLI